jgi:hypothetical protein
VAFEKLALFIHDILMFVTIGAFIEGVYVYVLPPLYSSLHLPIFYTILVWILPIIYLIKLARNDVAYVELKGFLFAGGVVIVAYYVHEWYSLTVALIALLLLVGIMVRKRNK